MTELFLKIILIGDTFTGKKSLLFKYTDDFFPENILSTIGVEFKEKKIILNDKKITLQIWLTSGQERFRSITQNFYRNADGIIFVFDVTKTETFNHIKDWLLDAQVEDSDIKRILVGNKTDLAENRVIDKTKMESFAETKKMKSFETSAKNGSNVDLIFTEIASLILANKTEKEINELYTKNPQNLSISSELTDPKKGRKCC